MLRSIPEVVSSRLAQAGVESADIEVPEPGGRLDRIDSTPHAVVLRLFPRNVGPMTTMPADWLDIAGEWVTADLGDGDSVRVRILTIESDVPASEVPGVIHECGL